MSEIGPENYQLGTVVSGSLSEGVKVRLSTEYSVENVKVGSNVVIQGKHHRFFGVVTDVSLGSSDLTLQYDLPDVSDSFMTEVLAGTTVYGTITVEPMLTIGTDSSSDGFGPMPAKTVPEHFSSTFDASEDDIHHIFGPEGDGHF